MKISFAFLLFGSFFFLSCSQENKDNGVAKIKYVIVSNFYADEEKTEPTKGELKEEIRYDYDMNYNVLKDNHFGNQNYNYEFDKKGRKIEMRCYYSDGKLQFYEIYKSDEKGNVIEADHYYSDSSLRDKKKYKYDQMGNRIEGDRYNLNDSLTEKYSCLYNNKGEIIEKNIFSKHKSYTDYALTYNAKGFLIEESEYDDNNLSTKSLFHYDSKGNMIELSEYNVDPDNEDKLTFESRINLTYDSIGNKIQIQELQSDDSVSITTYKYNEKRKMIEENGYLPDNSLERKIIYTYDAKDSLINTKCFRGDGNLWWVNNIKYDEKGNKIEEADYDNFGKLEGKTIYKHDDKGNLIKMIELKSDSALQTETNFKYNDMGENVEENRYESETGAESLPDETDPGFEVIGVGSSNLKVSSTYDEKKNIIKSKGLTEANIRTKYSYQDYDKHGNWRKKITFNFNKPIEITEREIHYY